MSEKFQRSLGLELAGPRSDKSVLAVLDYYPSQKRAVLGDIHQLSEKGSDSDIVLLDRVLESCNVEGECSGIGTNAPLSLPPYLNEDPGTKLPKIKNSENPEVMWMHQQYLRLERKGKAPRPIIPYLQRPAEFHLRALTAEGFPVSDAFSSNGASLYARMRFLSPYIPVEKYEIYTKASVLRICQSLEMPKFVELGYSSVTSGLEARHEFFYCLQEKLPGIFLYEEHIESMTLHLWIFNSFVLSLTELLRSQELCEKAPFEFPEESTWIHLPKARVDWSKLFG